jgi:hypothetical protein
MKRHGQDEISRNRAGVREGCSWRQRTCRASRKADTSDAREHVWMLDLDCKQGSLRNEPGATCRRLLRTVQLFGRSSEQLDKQYVWTPEPTGHQYLRPYLHKQKKNDFGQPIHNIKECKTKFHDCDVTYKSSYIITPETDVYELQDKYHGVSRISQFHSEISGPTYNVYSSKNFTLKVQRCLRRYEIQRNLNLCPRDVWPNSSSAGVCI